MGWVLVVIAVAGGSELWVRGFKIVPLEPAAEKDD